METMLPNSDDYRRWADACQAVSVAVSDTRYATMFAEMAQVWKAMAEQQEALGVAWPELLNSVAAPLPPELRRRLH
jgi:hypothetical protein